MISADLPSSNQVRFFRPERGLLLAATLLACIWSGGCAAVSNPVEDAIPVHRLPQEVIGRKKEEQRTISLALLGQKPPAIYQIGPGDVLGVFIAGVLGDEKVPPPVNTPEVGSNLAPSLGFPIPVRDDGTISLPFVKPIKVEKLSIAQVQAEIIRVYTKEKDILKLDEMGQPIQRVLVSLIRQRQYHIVVVRQDSGGLTVGLQGGLGQTKRGTGYVVNLPAYENDVLNALVKTGGLPGLDAENQVIIERAGVPRNESPEDMVKRLEKGGSSNPRIRIPLRLRPDEPIPFTPEDVILRDGDIVFIEARDTEVFYTGGLLPAHQFVLPRDYDLNVVEAVAFASGPFVNGALAVNNLSGNIQATGIGSPSPSLVTILRRTPNGGQIPIRVSLNGALRDPRQRVLIQPGDVIILQQTVGEAIINYMSTQLHLNFLGTIINQADLIGTTILNLP